MRNYSPTTAAYFARQTPFSAAVLLWISARDRTTNAIETIGLWTGVQHRQFTISGVARTYYGAGALLSVDPLRFRTGLQVRKQRVELSQIAPEVLTALRGYEPRHAPVEMHRALFDPNTEALIDEPHLLMRGYVDQMTVRTPKEGSEGSIGLELATSARALTKPLARKRSHATLTARAPGDGFRRYASIADKVDTDWGSA